MLFNDLARSCCHCVVIDFCKSDSCDELKNQINQCFGRGGGDLIHKREDAIAWENQMNGCLHYSCDDISGFIVRSKCEKNEICMDNNTCIDSNSNRDKWRVIVDIDAENTTLLNMTEMDRIESCEWDRYWQFDGCS